MDILCTLSHRYATARLAEEAGRRLDEAVAQAESVSAQLAAAVAEKDSAAVREATAMAELARQQVLLCCQIL